LSNKSVLIVDDNKKFLESAIKFLTTDKHFAIVGWAFDAAEAFEKIRKFSPDLVLLDFSLPDMNGLEAAKLIKQMPEAPIVVITSFNKHPEYSAEAILAGAEGFISKSDFGEEIIPLFDSLFSARSNGKSTEKIEKDSYS
jgi:DNA-binding NarL/FixJ family response regulator